MKEGMKHLICCCLCHAEVAAVSNPVRGLYQFEPCGCETAEEDAVFSALRSAGYVRDEVIGTWSWVGETAGPMGN